jgi:hypothetical protein
VSRQSIPDRSQEPAFVSSADERIAAGVPLAHLPLRRALGVVFGLLIASLVGRLLFTLWEPPFDGGIRFSDVVALGGSYWPTNLYLGGPSYALSFVTTAVFLVLLGRGRSSVLTLIGAVLVALGGIVFSSVIVSETWPYALAANPDVMPLSQGEGMFRTLNAHLGLLLPVIIGSQLVIAVGAVLGLIGIFIGRSAPRWFATTGLIYIVVFQLVPLDQLGHAFVLTGYVLQLALLAGIAVFALRTKKREA